MFKKVLSIVFAAILVFSLSGIPAMAAPYNGGNKISGEKTVIYAVTFDTDDYNEFTAELAGPGNWTWYFEAREAGGNYAHRTEYQANEDGPQTEKAEVSDFGEIGAICYTHGPTDGRDAEWIQYTVNVETAGKYGLKVWASTDIDDKSVNIYWGGAAIGSPAIQKAGWAVYNLHDVGTVDLSAGTGVLKVEWPGGDANIAAFEFTLLEAAPTEAPADDAEDGGDPADSADNSGSASDGDGGTMILWIVIAAAAVVIIVIIVILVTKKKN